MQKTLTLVVCLLVAAFIAGAATVSVPCVPAPPAVGNTAVMTFPGATGTQNASFLCPSFSSLYSGPLSSLDTVTVSNNASFSGGQCNGGNCGSNLSQYNGYNLLATYGGPFNFGPNPTLSTGCGGCNPVPGVPGTGNNGTSQTSSSGTAVTSAAGGGLASITSSFTVSASMTITTGQFTTGTDQKSVTYSYTIPGPPPGGTPEPATLSLIGFGLLGLGFVGRKFRNN